MRLSDKLRELAEGARDGMVDEVADCLCDLASEYDEKHPAVPESNSAPDKDERKKLSEQLGSIDQTHHKRWLDLDLGLSAAQFRQQEQEQEQEQLSERLGVLENLVDDNAALGGELIERANKDVLSRINIVENRVLQLSAQTADVGLAGIEESLRESIRDQRKEIISLKKSVSGSSKRLRSVSKAQANHDDRLIELEQRLNGLSNLIGNLSERLQFVDKTMRDRTTDIGKRLDQEIKKEIAEVDAKRVEFMEEYGKTELRRMREKLDWVVNQQVLQDERNTDLCNDHLTQAAKLKEADGKLAALRRDTKAKIGGLERTLSNELKERVNSESSPARACEAELQRGVWYSTEEHNVPKPEGGDGLVVASSAGDVELYWRDANDPEGCWKCTYTGLRYDHHVMSTWGSSGWLLLPRAPKLGSKP